MSNLHRFPKDTCACLPCYDNYPEEITLWMHVHGTRLRVRSTLVRVIKCHSCHRNGALWCMPVLLISRCRKCFKLMDLFRSRLFSHGPHASFSQTNAHKPGRTWGQGLQIKGTSKGKNKRGEERADWIKEWKEGTDWDKDGVIQRSCSIAWLSQHTEPNTSTTCDCWSMVWMSALLPDDPAAFLKTGNGRCCVTAIRVQSRQTRHPSESGKDAAESHVLAASDKSSRWQSITYCTYQEGQRLGLSGRTPTRDLYPGGRSLCTTRHQASPVISWTRPRGFCATARQDTKGVCAVGQSM